MKPRAKRKYTNLLFISKKVFTREEYFYYYYCFIVIARDSYLNTDFYHLVTAIGVSGHDDMTPGFWTRGTQVVRSWTFPFGSNQIQLKGITPDRREVTVASA